MNGLKIFLVVLFVAGLLFIIGITVGSGHSDDNNAQTPGWLSGFGARFVGQQPLKSADLNNPTPASCLQQGKFVVPVGSTCTFDIQRSTFTQRKATVQLVQGTSATVRLTQEQAVPVQESLTGIGAITNTDDLKVYPGKAHAALAIQCSGAGGAPACLLELK